MVPVLLGMMKTEVDIIFGGLTLALVLVLLPISWPVMSIWRSGKAPDRIDRQIQIIWLILIFLLLVVATLYLLLRRAAG